MTILRIREESVPRKKADEEEEEEGQEERGRRKIWTTTPTEVHKQGKVSMVRLDVAELGANGYQEAELLYKRQNPCRHSAGTDQ
jgi:hypothetical protein